MSPTVCLCMMVRNEAATIERALASALPFVDAWSICDTGSDDATRALVVQSMGDVPGRLHEHDWVDFAVNRTRAFKAAQDQGCDYILIMDADQTLVVTDPHCLEGLDKDGYNIEIKHGNLTYPHPWLLRSNKAWYWQGSTHEYLACDEVYSCDALSGLHLVEHADSYRRLTGAKTREDRAILEAAYQDNPTDPRTVFYLAQACSESGELSCAIRYYRERVRLGGWLEERWCAQYRIGRLLEAQGTWEFALDAYFLAYNLDPSRAEPLYRMAKGLLSRKQFAAASIFFGNAAQIPSPQNRLFVEEGVYDYQCLWGLSMAYRLLGRHEEAEELENEVLKGGRTPARVQAEIITSRGTRSIGTLPN